MSHRRNMFTNLERNMEYKIYCEDAASLIKTIFSCFKKNDKNGSRVKIDLQGKVLIHGTTRQQAIVKKSWYILRKKKKKKAV